MTLKGNEPLPQSSHLSNHALLQGVEYHNDSYKKNRKTHTSILTDQTWALGLKKSSKG